jgi:hypothetical protein
MIIEIGTKFDLRINRYFSKLLFKTYGDKGGIMQGVYIHGDKIGEIILGKMRMNGVE